MGVPKPIALIAVASGSNDVDVIVTASHLGRLGLDVLIASTAGWSPVTLQNGLVVRPTCSLERALDTSKKRFFDLLLLPNGDDISIGRLENNSRLATVVRDVARKNAELKSAKNEPSIVFAGKSARIFQTWKLQAFSAPGFFSSVAGFLKTWIISKAAGSNIIINSSSNPEGRSIVVCSAAPDDDPLTTVKVCVTIARKIAIRSMKQEEQKKLGPLKHAMLESYRKRQDSNKVSKKIRNFLEKLRDSASVPSWIRKFILSPICSTVCLEQPSAFHIGKLHPGNTAVMEAIQKAKQDMLEPTTDTLHLVSQSSAYVAGRIWDFVQDSLRLRKRSLAMCHAAVLVGNRVNEQLLAVLIHELRSKFKVWTHVIACDRVILGSCDPFIITRGMLQIRCDAVIERVKPCYDVIIAIDSEVHSRAPGMWYRKSSFGWDDFEVMRNKKGPPYVSCVTATFDDKTCGRHDLESVTRKRYNPLTSQWITLEDFPPENPRVTTPVPDAIFYGSCGEYGRNKKGGLFKELDEHDLVYQSFQHFHNWADMHTIISSENGSQDALDFARALTDCIRRMMAKNGHDIQALPTKASCCIL